MGNFHEDLRVDVYEENRRSLSRAMVYAEFGMFVRMNEEIALARGYAKLVGPNKVDYCERQIVRILDVARENGLEEKV